MILCSGKTKVKAPIDHVFSCMTDIEIFKKMSFEENRATIKSIEYNKKNPFGKGERIVVICEKVKTILIVEENKSPNYLKIRVIPYQKLNETFGGGYIETVLEQRELFTFYNYNFVSDRTPSGFWKVFVKFIGFMYKLSCRRAHNKFNGFVLEKK
ncbi:hypothetical protein QWI17_01400 [Gilvimarinus sp. SDUM040013]|uniref:Uncharacterized protein n=1 Tax=Gilvimarinus gilvus TaxID=3058038 RepID=A0ABU4S4A9_9GAMM|nr:hypothetical protein [Gilvimarinus sp. SDUM040013]MDO3384487.1 hypothetical protein [Gilvimarinus sp. SDUM040013]MDX6850728.1 hypothetical protein [Gilvimarinus sp. SDUM040013]